jgi:hypothetical protein
MIFSENRCPLFGSRAIDAIAETRNAGAPLRTVATMCNFAAMILLAADGDPKCAMA